MQPTKEESDLKKYNKLKTRLISLVDEYVKSKDNNIKNEILVILESVSGVHINIRKPPLWDNDIEFDRFKYLPSMIISIYNRKSTKPRVRFNELYELSEPIFKDIESSSNTE